MWKQKDFAFNRNEIAGAFGDIGTDFPILIAMVLAAGLHAPSVFIIFGCMQILTGIIYKRPMPVQPLKAMATIVITGKIAGPIVLGGGLSIGILMLFFSTTGILEKIAKFVPKSVVRGLQLGLGISLSMLAFKEYIPSESAKGYILAGISFLCIILLIDNRKVPASIVVIFFGFMYSLFFHFETYSTFSKFEINLPKIYVPNLEMILKGFILLTLPQIPLSIGNSILATKQISDDLFPNKKPVTIKKIGFSYSIMNLISPFFSGIPCCHGAGGMVGHYTFGGRTGVSVLLYGLFYLLSGLFMGNGLDILIKAFPLPILGTLLFFESLSLILLIKDSFQNSKEFIIVIMTGLLASGLPYGFLIAMIVGTSIHYTSIGFKTFTSIGDKNRI
ncbi:putative sulfate/molybdate transporter [Leptospira paudalimensis]|uniref:Sulfate/molybdate transporter n=1 Tax=Leptospira paudalimensis TaxID=2950024 RepID=A0ABT3M3Q9_9LEPT|nr:putative sulfate/molybdate transporter [Leptospira paudalimensis]MCW7503028.1 putative sulfate/molybdate transporter [Leptospira paudalimensis]